MARKSERLAEMLREFSRNFDELGVAADALEFFFHQMAISSAQMDGQHHWRLRNGRPMAHAVGRTPEDAILNAIDAVCMETQPPAKEGDENV